MELPRDAADHAAVHRPQRRPPAGGKPLAYLLDDVRPTRHVSGIVEHRVPRRTMCFMGRPPPYPPWSAAPPSRSSAAAARKCPRVVRAVVVSDIVPSLEVQVFTRCRDIGAPACGMNRLPANLLLSGSTPQGARAAAPTEAGTASGAARALPSVPRPGCARRCPGRAALVAGRGRHTTG